MHEVRARRLIQKSWKHNNPRCSNMLKLSFPHNNQKQPVNQKVNESIRPRKVLRRWGGLECCCFSRLQKFHSCWGEFSHWQLTLNQPWIPLWWDPPDIPSFPQPGKPHHYMVCDGNLSHEAEIKRLQGLLYRISANQSQRCKIKQVHIQAIFSVGTFNLLAAPMRICCLASKTQSQSYLLNILELHSISPKLTPTRLANLHQHRWHLPRLHCMLPTTLSFEDWMGCKAVCTFACSRSQILSLFLTDFPVSRSHRITALLFRGAPPINQCVSRSEFRGAQRSLPAIDFMSNLSPRKVGKAKSLTLSLCLKCFRHFSHVVQQKKQKKTICSTTTKRPLGRHYGLLPWSSEIWARRCAATAGDVVSWACALRRLLVSWFSARWDVLS